MAAPSFIKSSQRAIPASQIAPPSARALTPEWAAKLGHVCTTHDPQICEMLAEFQQPAAGGAEGPEAFVDTVDTARTPPLDHVIAVGGSFASVPNVLAPQKV